MTHFEFKHLESDQLTPLEKARGNFPAFPWEEIFHCHYLPQAHKIALPWLREQEPKNWDDFESYCNFLTRFIHSLVVPILASNRVRDGINQIKQSTSRIIEQPRLKKLDIAVNDTESLSTPPSLIQAEEALNCTCSLEEAIEEKSEALGGLRDIKFGYFGNPGTITAEEFKQGCLELITAEEQEEIDLEDL